MPYLLDILFEFSKTVSEFSCHILANDWVYSVPPFWCSAFLIQSKFVAHEN